MIKLHANLRKIAGIVDVSIAGTNLGACVLGLVEAYPTLDGVIVEDGQIRPHFIVMLNGHSTTDLDAVVCDEDRIAIFPPIAGG